MICAIEFEAGAALWDGKIEVDMGESQGAEDELWGEERQEADQDHTGQQYHRGGQHCRLQQRLVELCHVHPDRRSEKGEGKSKKSVLHRFVVTSMEAASDSNTN